MRIRSNPQNPQQASAPAKHHRLAKGSTGPAVKRLEEKLIERGLLKGAADNHFDSKTQAAVKKYERNHDFKKVDGVVGDRIWRQLKLGGAAHEGQVSDQPVPGSKDTFKTVTINVKSNPVMDQASVVHDVKRAAKEGSLIGWNEIGPERYRKAIRDLGPDWGHYMPHDGGLKIPNPISWKKSEWKLKGEGFLKTHNGEAKVSPNRYITWVKLENKKTGKTIVRMNTHLVSGAFSEPKPTTGWRREMWHKHMEKLHDLVARFEKKGYPVIVGGDFNRDSFKVLGNQVKYDNDIHVGTHGKSTYDYLMHTPNSSLQSHGAKVDHGFRSDHDSVAVTYTIKG